MFEYRAIWCVQTLRRSTTPTRQLSSRGYLTGATGEHRSDSGGPAPVAAPATVGTTTSRSQRSGDAEQMSAKCHLWVFGDSPLWGLQRPVDLKEK